MGVYHRNLRPDHLMLDRQGVVKVVGFGLAHIKADPLIGNESGAKELTSQGMVLGTAEYMAPEQAANAAAADQRSDVYSLGCTLYALLTGRPPYPGKLPVQQMVARASQPIPSLRQTCPTVSESLDAVFRKMLAKRPKDRYALMAEVHVALKGCLKPSPQAPIASQVEDAETSSRSHHAPRDGFPHAEREDYGVGHLTPDKAPAPIGPFPQETRSSAPPRKSLILCGLAAIALVAAVTV